MSTYALLLVAHIVCVIVWLGTTTTFALLAVYGGRARDRELVDRLPAIARWLGPRAVGPSSAGTLLSGILLAANGNVGAGEPWLVLALGAFVAAAAISVGVRLPATLWRRRAVEGGRLAEVERADRLLLEGLTAELAILYLAAAGMVLKPTAGGAWWLAGGAAIVALMALRALSAGAWRRRPSSHVSPAGPTSSVTL